MLQKKMQRNCANTQKLKKIRDECKNVVLQCVGGVLNFIVVFKYITQGFDTLSFYAESYSYNAKYML